MTGTATHSLRGVIAFLLISSFAVLPVAMAEPTVMCDGETATIVGTAGADVLVGTAKRDVIHGRGGNDVINGLGGNDVVCGGRGNDTIRGGPGSDRMFGGAGGDTLLGKSGSDFIVGGAGNDALIGGKGTDRMFGNAGADVLDGGNGPDKLWGGAAWDDCYSGERRDPCEGPVFLETFDGEPASPAPFKSNSTMTVSTNSRTGSTRDKLATMQADHGADCAGPPASHTVTNYDDAHFRCRNHMMTAISSGPTSMGNYAVSMFSPNAILDFSAGEAVIQFDVSTLRRSRRDWFEVWITPYADLLRIPVQDRPSMQGPPKNAVVVSLKAFTDIGSFDVAVHRNFHEIQIDGPVEWTGYENFLTPSATVRSKFEIRITKDHIVVGMPDEPFYWISEDIPGGLPFDKGIVQFGHNSYDVFNCDECGAGPGTWHWDNIYLAPAEPMTVLQSNRRFVNNSSASFVTFPSPAPANAKVQFTGIGFDLEVSFDNGQTWKPAVTQHNREIYHWRYKNYSMAVPPGTTRVDFRGTDPYDGHWQIQDISIVSKVTPAGAYTLNATPGELAVELIPLPAIGCIECVGLR